MGYLYVIYEMWIGNPKMLAKLIRTLVIVHKDTKKLFDKKKVQFKFYFWEWALDYFNFYPSKETIEAREALQ